MTRWLTMVSSLVLTGCFGTSQQPVYYALEGDAAKVVPHTRTEAKLVVTRFDVRAQYDRPELVYRKNERELRFYPFDLWASKPGRMMAEAVTAHVRQAGLFATVTMQTMAGDADYELRGEVLTLEELDLGERDWHAHLAMRFELVRLSDEEVVMRHAFDETRPVPERKVAAVADKLDEILGQELVKVTGLIAAALPR